MTNMIEELWYSTINPNRRALLRRDNANSAIHKQLKSADRIMEDILTEEQLFVFENYRQKTDDIISRCEMEAFIDGYKIATRLILSCFNKDKNIFDDIL